MLSHVWLIAKRENVGCCMVRELTMHLLYICICACKRRVGRKSLRCRRLRPEKKIFSLDSRCNHLLERVMLVSYLFLCTTPTEEWIPLCYLCGWSCITWKRRNISRLFGLLLYWGSLWSLWSLLLLCEQEYILNMFVYILGSLFWYVHLGVFGIWVSVLNTL